MNVERGETLRVEVKMELLTTPEEVRNGEASEGDMLLLFTRVDGDFENEVRERGVFCDGAEEHVTLGSRPQFDFVQEIEATTGVPVLAGHGACEPCGVYRGDRDRRIVAGVDNPLV